MTPILLFALLPLSPLSPPETVLAVDNFVVGSRARGGWSAAGVEFAKRHRALDFRPFGVGKVGGSSVRRGFVSEEVDGGTYLDSGSEVGDRDMAPLLAGAVPKVPRVVESLPAGPVYEAACRRFLKSRGVSTPKARITKVFRADLDGDGTSEILIEATSQAEPSSDGTFPKGAYSFVLLRAIKGGTVVESALEFATRSKEGMMERKRLRGIADLDGDGRMEILTTGLGFEWNNAQLWSYRKGVARKLLENGVGH